MKLNDGTKNLINIISIILIILAILIFLYIIFYFQKHSPEFLTHEQFYTAMAAIAFAFSSAFLGIWMNISNKLTDFAKEIGELKGMFNQYMKNHSSKTDENKA